MTDEMTLDEALAVLCRAHIRDFDLPIWHVEIPSSAPAYLHHPMIQAWGRVRRHVLAARSAATEPATTE